MVQERIVRETRYMPADATRPIIGVVEVLFWVFLLFLLIVGLLYLVPYVWNFIRSPGIL